MRPSSRILRRCARRGPAWKRVRPPRCWRPCSESCSARRRASNPTHEASAERGRFGGRSVGPKGEMGSEGALPRRPVEPGPWQTGVGTPTRGESTKEGRARPGWPPLNPDPTRSGVRVSQARRRGGSPTLRTLAPSARSECGHEHRAHVTVPSSGGHLVSAASLQEEAPIAGGDGRWMGTRLGGDLRSRAEADIGEVRLTPTPVGVVDGTCGAGSQP